MGGSWSHRLGVVLPSLCELFMSPLHSDSLLFMTDQANILDKTANWSHSISYTNSLMMYGKPLGHERAYYKIW